jgi:ABC-type nitrate/sulfonate/bicarbonate transport system substrate-binding protein
MIETAPLVRLTLLLAFIVNAFVVPAYGQEKKLDRLLLSNSTITESRMPLYMAKALGLYAKYGLDAEIVHIRGAGVNIAALVAGEIDMAVASGSFAIVAAARGAPIVIIATTGPIKYDLVSGSLASPRELKGKTIGMAGFTSGDYFVLLRLLPKLGLIPDKDVTLLPVGSTASYDRMNMMAAGKIDAVLANKSNVERIRAQGVKLNVVASTTDYGLDGSGGDFFVTRESLRNRPARIKAALRAVSEAIRLGRDNPELFARAVRGVLKETNPKLIEALYRQSYFFGNEPRDAGPLAAALDSDISDFSATVPELRGRRASEFIDTSILAELEKEGFFRWRKR